MTTVLLTIHILSSIFLIIVVLLQKGKGADMGASFGGGGSQALFGSAGPATFLTKITTVIAIVFMLTSLSLAYRSGHKSFSSVMPTSGPVPVEQKAATAQTPSPVAKNSVKANASAPADTKADAGTK